MAEPAGGKASDDIADNYDSKICTGTASDKAADFANYFCSYAYLYHQKQMLVDRVRMSGYYSAIMSNAELFKGKIVMDVGTGSGVLSVWAAKAGAAKVYAIEYTDMAKCAQVVVDHNGVHDIVEVIQSSVEELKLPDGLQVDIIISEWMGYFLLRESMLDSVIRARDKYLKPVTGLMFPSHAKMYWSLISNEGDRQSKIDDYYKAMDDWRDFTERTRNTFDVDMDCLFSQFEEEQRKYYICSAVWVEMGSSHIVSVPAVILDIDLHTCTIRDTAGIHDCICRYRISQTGLVSGFAGWFTVDFKGREGMEFVNPVTLSTAPEVGYTHWGQQAFYLQNPILVQAGQTMTSVVSMTRQTVNQRLYNVKFTHRSSEGSVELEYELP